MLPPLPPLSQLLRWRPAYKLINLLLRSPLLCVTRAGRHTHARLFRAVQALEAAAIARGAAGAVLVSRSASGLSHEVSGTTAAAAPLSGAELDALPFSCNPALPVCLPALIHALIHSLLLTCLSLLSRHGYR